MTQDECRDLVRVLELKAELSHLLRLKAERERKAQLRVYAATMECTRAGVTGDGRVVYIDTEKRCRVVVPQ